MAKSNGSAPSGNVGVQPLPLDVISESQQAAILALVAGSTDTAAAAAAGVDRSTLHRWRVGDPAFVACLNLSRQRIWDETTDELRAAVGAAIGVLLQDLRDDDMTVRRAAARDVLKLTGVPPLEPDGAVTTRQVERGWQRERTVSALDLVIDF